MIDDPARDPDPTALRRRLLAVLHQVGETTPGTAAGLETLCRLLRDDLDLLGVTVTLMTDDGPQGEGARSHPEISKIDAVQFDVGEGPSREAFQSGRPVLVDDLTQTDGRWPGFASETGAHDVAAVFAFPLQFGAMGLGVLTCYSARVGGLTHRDATACAVYADVCLHFLIDQGVGEKQNTGKPDPANGRPDAGHEAVPSFLEEDMRIRTEVYQAQGMVMVELGVSLVEALARLRASAFAAGLSLNDLATEVVAGRWPFTDPPGPDVSDRQATSGNPDGPGA